MAEGDDAPTVTVTAKRLSEDDLRKRLKEQGYPDAAVSGIVQNAMRESGGSPTAIGDSGTSRGLFQWHATRKADLEDYARKEGASPDDPDVQFKFFDREMREKFPKLRESLMTETDPARAESAFKRIFERPASVMWENTGERSPVLGNDRYRFSDYALGERRGRRSSLVYMDPSDYLALSPELESEPFTSRSGKSLLASVGRGDEIQSVPSLDMRVNGPTGTVTGQDGRHRALLAQQEGVDQIPVELNQRGSGDPTEIAGMNGTVLPNDFMPASKVAREPSERGILGRALDMVIPRAEAAEANPFAQFLDEPQASKPEANPFEQFLDHPPKPPTTTAPGIAASVTRGLAPYAAGAAAGAGLGSLAGGVGAIPGAVAGAGAVALGDLATSVAKGIGVNIPTFTEASDKVLDWLGIRRPQTAAERMAETTGAGMAGAGAGVRTAEMLASTLTQPASRAVAFELAKRPTLQIISGGGAGLGGQLAGEAGLGPAGQAFGSTIGALAPFPRNPFSARINASPQAKATIEAGFVLPPAEASAGHIGEVNLPNLAAAEAGKVKLGQLAAAKNQPLVNLYAQKELGLEPGTVLTPNTFKQVRDREGQVYREVASAVPEVDLARDPQFRSEAEKVGSRSAETERLFPSTTEPPGVKALRQELLTHARGGTNAVMNYIADLRFKATKNFQAVGDAQAHRMGAAQREAASALEDAMERSVQNAPQYYGEKLDQAIARRAEATADLDYANRSHGVLPASDMGRKIEAARNRVEAANAEVRDWQARLENAHNKNAANQTLVDRFREARKIMAKSYDVESVTNASTGDVSATGLGRLLQRGKPLTGDLKLIADSANSFRRAFQNPAAFGGVEPLSVLDAGAAAIMALHGHPIAAASVLTRPWLRGRVLTPGYQQRMISDRPTAATGPSVPLSALGTPLLPGIQRGQ